MQLPPFLHGLLRQAFDLDSHLEPLKLIGQLQIYPFPELMHVPPFRHGLLRQAFDLDSHLVPAKLAN